VVPAVGGLVKADDNFFDSGGKEKRVAPDIYRHRLLLPYQKMPIIEQPMVSRILNGWQNLS